MVHKHTDPLSGCEAWKWLILLNCVWHISTLTVRWWVSSLCQIVFLLASEKNEERTERWWKQREEVMLFSQIPHLLPQTLFTSLGSYKTSLSLQVQQSNDGDYVYDCLYTSFILLTSNISHIPPSLCNFLQRLFEIKTARSIQGTWKLWKYSLCFKGHWFRDLISDQGSKVTISSSITPSG